MMRKMAALSLFMLLLPACSLVTKSPAPVAHDPDISQVPDAIPRKEGKSRYGNPASYVVRGKRYHTLGSSAGYEETGTASWSGRKFHGRRTSSGETYDMYKMTAAHKTLPLPTYVEVTRVDNGSSVVVRVNDRGPFVGDRIIDLSYAAAERLGMRDTGTAEVTVRAISADDGGAVATAPAAGETPGKAPSLEQAQAKSGQVYVQLGAFRDRVLADDYAKEVERLDLGKTRIKPVNLEQVGLLHKVWLGPFPSRATAGKVMMQLFQQGFEGFIVSADN